MSARIFGHYCSAEGIELFALELLAMAAGLGAALGAVSLGQSAHALWPWALPAAVLLTLEAALYFGDLHDLGVAERDLRPGSRLLRSLGMGSILLGLAGWILPGSLQPRILMAAVAPAVLCAVAARWCYLARLRRPRRLVLIGRGARAAAIERAVEREGSGRFVVAARVSAVPAAGADSESAAVPLSRLIGETRADLVVVAEEDRRGSPSELLLACRLRGVAILEAAQFIERLERRIPLDLARPGDLAFAEGPLPTAARLAVKRAFDLAAAALLLVFAAPVMALAALAVRLGSRGPILYRQERLGRDGRPYTLVKFRTMRTDAEAATGPVWAQERDPRVTRVGAFLRRSRLDELPQLFNVLGGSMSLVGPRPEREFFAGHLRERIPLFDLRLAAKPGVTGWAQLRYPYGASIEDARAKLELDLYYLKNWSPFLDLVVAFHTAKHVLLGRGAR
ncbi:MAG: exopolysaccharide biosynthesis polyprenyl glycosylphosphotransferase [Myxococcales bacterium]